MVTSLDGHARGLRLWMAPVALASAAISYFWMQQDHVAAGVLAAVLLAGLSGYRMGAARLAGLLLGAAAAAAYAPAWAAMCTPRVAELLGTTQFTSQVVSIGTIGAGIVAIATMALARLSRVLLDDRPLLEAMNRWSGFLLGGVQGTGVALLALGGMLVVEPLARQRVAESPAGGELARSVSERVVELAERTRQSQFGPIVNAYNPFQRLPQLDRLQESMHLARDPEKMNRLIESSQTEQMMDRPALRRAIDSLAADAEIQQVLRSGKPIDSHTAIALMNNPTIKRLLDEPEFIHEMSKMLSEMDLAP